MINGLFSRAAPHEHAEPVQRIRGLAELSPDSHELAQLLLDDPAPEVRVAAARRSSDLAALIAASSKESDAAAREAIAAALAAVLAETADHAAAMSVLSAQELSDQVRAEVARRTRDAERRRLAIAAMHDEDVLIELAVGAELAETRIAAAERVTSAEGLRKLAESSRNKDHGVSRIARQRIDAIKNRIDLSAEADAILDQLEALAGKPGPVLTEMVELNRRWLALDMSADPARLARGEEARKALQARLDRDQETLKSKARLEANLEDWLASLPARAENGSLDEIRIELADLREEASRHNLPAALGRLDEAGERLVVWEQQRAATAGAEALVLEAEKLVADTTIDPGTLPERWQTLDRSLRTPALTRRFEAALIVVEQRRLAHAQLAQQEAAAVRGRIHALLHAAEQALAAGQLRDARSALDQLRTLRSAAGNLPKPTVQRIGRLVQQLVELERWQTFGQQNARVQLCERAEAAAALKDPRQVAQEVQQLRAEWKKLDEQYAGVPKALWERFDGACEKAYAPAARYFAELNASRKAARKQREEFITATQAQVATLMEAPRDWRALERALRDTEQKWREGGLGSLEPRIWKNLDTEFKAALAPVRDALSQAREQAKAARQQLIDEVTSLGANALDRDAPSKVKAIQTKWQEQAKALSLAQRDERALWESFRSACDAVFKARQDKRDEASARKLAGRKALEDVCIQLESLAQPAEKSDQEVRRASREAQDLWRKLTRSPDPAQRELDGRFRKAVASVETALAARARLRQTAVWDTLADKHRLCEQLDELAMVGADADEAVARAAAIQSQWSAMPALPAACEKKIVARREAATRALADAGALRELSARIEKGAEARRDGLLELELLLGLESPPQLQAQRLALQVKQLRDRFKSAVTVTADTAGERLCDWCALPGKIDPDDRARAERVFAAVKRQRKG
jgi:hypothetical protein